jgi:adenine-specific DNA-methyltransferase
MQQVCGGRPNLYYAIIHPVTGEEILPSKTRVWGYSREVHLQHVKDNCIWWGKDGANKVPSYKRFLSDVGGIIADTWWD